MDAVQKCFAEKKKGKKKGKKQRGRRTARQIYLGQHINEPASNFNMQGK